MDIETSRKGNAAIFALKGDVDFDSYRSLKDALEDALEKNLAPIVLDFTSVGHIDSMGLGTVTKMWKKAKEKGIELVLSSCNKNVEKMVHLINLDRRIKLFPTVHEAVNDGGAAT